MVKVGHTAVRELYSKCVDIFVMKRDLLPSVRADLNFKLGFSHAPHHSFVPLFYIKLTLLVG